MENESKNELLRAVQESLILTNIDLKAEAIARELSKKEFTLEDLFFLPEGIFKRGYENDVSSIKPFDYYENQQSLTLHINREGLFDTLPEGFFYQPPPYDAYEISSNDLEEKRIESSKEMNEAMDAAKLFFRPFDNINFQVLTQLEIIENEAFASMISIKSKICDMLWPEWENVLSKAQKSQLFTITLNAHRTIGKLSYIAKELTTLLGTDVNLKKAEDSTLKSKQERFNKLGIAKLGVDSFLYVSEIANIAYLQIAIGPMPYDEAVDYMENKPKWRLVNFIAELLLPLEMDWEIIPSILKQKNGFELSHQSTILGLNTWI